LGGGGAPPPRRLNRKTAQRVEVSTRVPLVTTKVVLECLVSLQLSVRKRISHGDSGKQTKTDNPPSTAERNYQGKFEHQLSAGKKCLQ